MDMNFVEATQNATTHHHIMNRDSQSPVQVRKQEPGTARSGEVNRRAMSLRTQLPRPTAKPILVGDPNTLRALRAAEMAAWNAGSSTKLNVRSDATQHKALRTPRLPTPERSDDDVWGLLTLTLCAVAGLIIGMGDLSSFLAGWTRVMAGIRLLLQ